MDILKMLKEERDNLSFDELDYLEDELLINHYEKNYIEECKRIIYRIKNSKKDKESKKYGVTFENIQDLLIDSNYLEANSTDKAISLDEQLMMKIETIRSKKNYDEKFSEIIDELGVEEDIIDRIFPFFNKHEILILCSKISFSEVFLGKYIKQLDANTISRYQYFSEEFFQKYFQYFNANIVIKDGVNEWRKKEKMSKKLEVFLKLKGVKL